MRVSMISRNRFFRLGIEKTIEQWEGFEVGKSLHRGMTCFYLQDDPVANIVLVDLEPEYDWEREKVREIKRLLPRTLIVGISSSFSECALLPNIHSGICGFLAKDSTENEIKRCLLHVRRHGYYINSRLAQTLAEEFLSAAYCTTTQPSGGLNNKELQTLDLACKGASNHAIARTLGISSRTVEGYKLKIRQKLNAATFVGAVSKAIGYGIIQVGR